MAPLFDVPAPVLREGESLEEHLFRVATGAHGAWSNSSPMYVDVHDFPLETRVATGVLPITFLFDILKQYGSSAVPVTGVKADREIDYLHAVGKIVGRDGKGACLRLQEDDLSDLQGLNPSVIEALAAVGLATGDIDLILDFGFIGGRNPDSLSELAIEALRTISVLGTFRNVIVSGTSVPERLGKKDQGKIRRERRIEVPLWQRVARTLGHDLGIVFSDCGVIGARYVTPTGPVRVPPRIRYSNSVEHLFLRGKPGEYAALCRTIVESNDFAGGNFSVGDRHFEQCAAGPCDSGNATTWVKVLEGS